MCIYTCGCVLSSHFTILMSVMYLFNLLDCQVNYYLLRYKKSVWSYVERSYRFFNMSTLSLYDYISISANFAVIVTTGIGLTILIYH